MRVHFLYQIFSLIKLFDIWERQQGILLSSICTILLCISRNLYFLFLKTSHISLIMALTMSISGFIFGFGPWVFNQILAFGVLMALWSLIAPRLSLVWQIALVTLLSFLYGVLMDYSYGLLFRSGITFVISGLLYDTYHAVSTLLFYPFIQSIFRRFLK